MPDSDDLLFYGSLKQLLEIALTTKSDMVIADFEQMSSSEIEAYLKIVRPLHNRTSSVYKLLARNYLMKVYAVHIGDLYIEKSS